MTDFLEFMQMENSHKTGTIPVEKCLDGEYEIEFKDESFHYPNSEEMITLNGIDIRQIIEKLKNLTPELQQAAAVKNKIEKGE